MAHSFVPVAVRAWRLSSRTKLHWDTLPFEQKLGWYDRVARITCEQKMPVAKLAQSAARREDMQQLLALVRSLVL